MEIATQKYANYIRENTAPQRPFTSSRRDYELSISRNTSIPQPQQQQVADYIAKAWMKDNGTNFSVRAVNIYKTNSALQSDPETTTQLEKLLQLANIHLPYNDEIRAFIKEMPIYNIDQIQHHMATIQQFLEMEEMNNHHANSAISMKNHKEEEDPADYNPRLPPMAASSSRPRQHSNAADGSSS